MKACHTQSMPTLSCLVSTKNLCFSGAKQFKNKKYPFRRKEKRSGILVCISEHFHDVGADILIFKPYVFLAQRAFTSRHFNYELKNEIQYEIMSKNGGEIHERP